MLAAFSRNAANIKYCFLAQVFTAGKDKHKCVICGVLPGTKVTDETRSQIGNTCRFYWAVKVPQ